MSLKNNLHYLSVSLSQFLHYFHHNVRGAAAGTAVPAAAPLTTSKIYSSRFFILFTLIRIVDPLCKSAVVVGGSTPATPRAMSPELKPTIFR